MFGKVFETSSSFANRNKDLSNQFYHTGNFASLTFLALALPSILFNKYIFYVSDDTAINFFAGAIFAAAVCFISVIFRFLTLSGALSAFLLAVPIFGFGGIKWSLPILTFFILSSVLSKFRENRNPELKNIFAKSDRRDHIQVFANGGIACLLLIINRIFFKGDSELIYAVFVSSLAAACADTWGTEIGTLFKKKTLSILNFRTVSPGSSGGISVPGTFGAAAGALIIALSSLFWVNQNIFNYIFLISAAGISGSIVDSILGASVQRKNICAVCRNFTERLEHCGETLKHYSGFKWLCNDVVLFCCSVSGALFVLFFKLV
ncbi:MAG: DUF92 domain-containing protein [Ignavibacteria bacterium]